MNKRIRKKIDKSRCEIYVKNIAECIITHRIFMRLKYNYNRKLNILNIKRVCRYSIRQMSYLKLELFVIMVTHRTAVFFNETFTPPVNGEISAKNVLRQLGVLSESMGVPIVTDEQRDYSNWGLHPDGNPVILDD